MSPLLPPLFHLHRPRLPFDQVFLNDHSVKPSTRMEAVAVSVAGAVSDSNVALIVTISATGEAPRLVGKYRPPVPQV